MHFENEGKRYEQKHNGTSLLLPKLSSFSIMSITNTACVCFRIRIRAHNCVDVQCRVKGIALHFHIGASRGFCSGAPEEPHLLSLMMNERRADMAIEKYQCLEGM